MRPHDIAGRYSTAIPPGVNQVESEQPTQNPPQDSAQIALFSIVRILDRPTAAAGMIVSIGELFVDAGNKAITEAPRPAVRPESIAQKYENSRNGFVRWNGEGRS